MSDPETAPGALFTSRRVRDQRKLFRFDSTVSMGTLLQMALIAGGLVLAYGTYQSDKAKSQMEVEQIKVDANAQRTQMKEQMTELRVDVKEVQRSIGSIEKSLIEMKAQQAPQPRRTP